MDAATATLAAVPPVLLGLVGSFIAGLGTGVGALLIYLVPRMTERSEDLLLGFSAGIMLAAAFFSLIQPGLEAASSIYPTLNPALPVTAGVLAGALALWLLHNLTPHEHPLLGRQGPAGVRVQKMWLIVLAITIHNLPEGLAVGVGFGGPDLGNAIGLMAGIGLQNMPEGLVVAVAISAAGHGRSCAFLLALLTGMVEPLGGLLGAAAVGLAAPLLPWGLAAAAGAMLFVISNEIIPETHRRGYEASVTFALLGGFGLMMYLDQSLR